MDSSVSRLTELVFILRTWFSELGVTEVTTPILIDYPTVEPTISNLKINSIEKYLRTSSEFEPKKILIEKDIDVFEIGMYLEPVRKVLCILPSLECWSGTNEINPTKN